jgi:hypothetical protein
MAGEPPFRGSGVPPSAEGRSYDARERREELPEGLPEAPPCPFCDGTETEVMNSFGSHASVSTYWCRDCRSPFEIMKWRGGGLR